jgi:hypothetical protein
MNTTATQTERDFIQTISKTYGPSLENANRAQLAELLSDCALEMYCRHCTTSYPSKLLDAIHFPAVAEDALLATAIGAAMRLRLFDALLIGLVKELAAQTHEEFGEPTYVEYPDY